MRPQIEAHGVEGSDGIEGVYMEKNAVAGRHAGTEAEAAAGSRLEGGSSCHMDAAESRKGRKGRRQRRAGRSDTDQLLGGFPYHHFVSAQCGKEHTMLQVRC